MAAFPSVAGRAPCAVHARPVRCAAPFTPSVSKGPPRRAGRPPAHRPAASALADRRWWRGERCTLVRSPGRGRGQSPFLAVRCRAAGVRPRRSRLSTTRPHRSRRWPRRPVGAAAPRGCWRRPPSGRDARKGAHGGHARTGRGPPPLPGEAFAGSLFVTAGVLAAAAVTPMVLPRGAGGTEDHPRTSRRPGFGRCADGTGFPPPPPPGRPGTVHASRSRPICETSHDLANPSHCPCRIQVKTSGSVRRRAPWAPGRVKCRPACRPCSIRHPPYGSHATRRGGDARALRRDP